MRTRAAALLSAMAIMGGMLAFSSSPVSAAPVSGQPFTAYGSGAAVITKALQLGNTSIANAEAAFSGGAVSTGGLNSPVTNEFGINVAGAAGGKNAIGRGTGLEVGLVNANPQPTTLNQVLLSAVATATAPPPSGPVTREVPLNVNPVAFASLLRGQAAATYDPTFCPIGKPLTYGLGYASNLQLLNTGTGSNAQTGFTAPAVGTAISASGTPRGASQSRTVTYMVANGDGSFGVASETRQTVAPISLLANQTLGTAVTVEIAGEFGLRTVATGKPGGSSVSFVGNPVLTVTSTVLGIPTTLVGPVSLESLLGQNGVGITIPGIATVGLGTPPRALNGALNTKPALAANGTSASGAVDTVRLALLNTPGLGVLDLALGHMEGAVSVPAGGIRCDIPVTKVATSNPVSIGSDFAFQISIPSNAAQFATLFNCDLTNISAVDVVDKVSGNPTIQFLSADHGGVVSGNRITFANVGNYVLGGPPIVLTINARIPSSSGAGALRDTVNVNAALGNCRGGATGEDIINGTANVNGTATISGIARLAGSAITGSFTLNGPNVGSGAVGGELAATGGNAWPLVTGGSFLLVALGLLRLRRRAAEPTPAQS
ncbi:MAG: hypothetical protein M3Y04_07280 [Actinomycetota bacterium]|nr:hypothetical protein [Actinomycetota bacterium]